MGRRRWLLLGVLALAACGEDTGRTRDQAEAAADAAVEEYPRLEAIGRNELANLAAETCGELDDGKTGPDLVRGMGMSEAAIELTSGISVMVDRLCPEHRSRWRGE